MPHDLPEDAILDAEVAVAFAQQVRRYHRRRTDKKSAQRVEDIELALERLRDAMKPLRSWRGGYAFVTHTSARAALYDQVSDASEAIQKERIKLWKMRGKKEDKKND